MKDSRHVLWACLACLVLGLVVGAVGSRCDFTPGPEVPVVVEPAKPKADRVVYVYEQRDGSIPSAIAAGLDKLNRQGIEATPFEDDSTDGDNDVPDQYRVPLKAATDAGLPVLVVLAGDEVLKVVKVQTAEQVTEAIK